MKRVLAVLLVFDAVIAIALTWSLTPSDISHPNAPNFLFSIGGHPPVLLFLGALTLIGAWQFAFTRRTVQGALLALLSVGLLVESQAALLEGPMRFLFFTGAVTVGWLAGHYIGRDREDSERFSDAGALGALAACYLGALISKLVTSGGSWVFDGGLRSTIAAQHRWGSSTDGLARFVLEHEGVANAMAAFTLLAQASAVLLIFGLRARRIACVLLLLFHAGVWLLTPISFPQAMVLLVVAMFVPASDSDGPVMTELRPNFLKLAIATLVFVGVAWLPPLREYTALHHHRAPSPQPLSPRERETATTTVVPGLPVGLELEGFRIVSIEPGPLVRCERGAESVVVELVAPGARTFEPPARSKKYDVFYRSPAPGEAAPPDEQRLALLTAIARALDAAP
ncbi:MAG: hypothetical protein JNM17_39750 [Archangium sp.]|nr:hypothetical protein [Archangium sp.]